MKVEENLEAGVHLAHASPRSRIARSQSLKSLKSQYRRDCGQTVGERTSWKLNCSLLTATMDIFDSKIERRLRPKDGSIDILADSVDQLKALFKAEFEQNEQLYDRRDFDRFFDQSDDWHARRWIIYQRDVPTAFEMLKDTMRWRKELDLNGLSYENFPREFFECGCTFEYGQDKKGE